MLSSFAQVNLDHPWFFSALAFLLGAIVGSFLNVCIYRMPANQSIVTPGSHCACGKPIAWYDNLPILSWLILRGKARCCGRPYSIRYAFVELLTAALFLACWLLFPPSKAACGWVLVSALVAATFIDLDHFIIPDTFTVGLGVAGVMLATAVPALHGHAGDPPFIGNMRSMVDALQGLLIGSGFVLWIALIAEALLKKEAMGFGDVKFVGAIGAFTGWQGAVFAVFGGAIVGLVWISLAMAVQKLSGKKVSVAPRSETAEGEPVDLGFGVHVPFGPMLAVAGLAHFLWFHTWMADYFTHNFVPLR